ncbi:MAG: hypothetical protein QM691_05160 [Opitutaceae bacterium]
MRTLAKLLSSIALAGTILPATLYLADLQTLDRVKLWMLAATVLWFSTVPFWMGREDKTVEREASSRPRSDL